MKKGMIKVSVMYPSTDGKKFDLDYYCDQHVPMVGTLLGDAVKGAAIEKGLAGAAPGTKPAYVTIGALYFENMASFQNAFGPNAAEIMADLPNFTDIEPVVQISEVWV